MKIKQISREQYRTLAALKMPVAAINGLWLPTNKSKREGTLMDLLLYYDVQVMEHRDYLRRSEVKDTFYTLVDSDEDTQEDYT